VWEEIMTTTPAAGPPETAASVGVFLPCYLFVIIPAPYFRCFEPLVIVPAGLVALAVHRP
jgi:hypothetical protein